MLNIALSILLTLLQTPHFGKVVGLVKPPEGSKITQTAHVALLPPKYTEVWNKQVQTRLDNYWELFKPDFAKNREHFSEYNRAAQVESFRYITANMRRELGEGASKLIKDSTPTGQFEFANVPFGTYELLVQTTINGQDFVWSKTVDVQSEIPIFVDIGKPVS